jgi:dihydroorotase
VTTVADMPNNPKPTTSVEALDQKKTLAAQKAVTEVVFYGGVRGDDKESLAKISKGVVAYKVYLSESTGAKAFPDSELGKTFALVARTGRPLSLHCEDQAVIDEMAEKLRGVDRPDLFCDLRPPSAEAESVRKVIASLRGVPGLRANICHASTAATLELVRGARKAGLGMSCEAALHHLYYNRKAVFGNRLLRTNPPLRREEDRRAVLRGLMDGTVSFLTTDHAPHLEEEKLDLGLAGVPGLDDYSHVVSWLITRQGFDPVQVSRVASANPARHLGLADRGEIIPGKRGDLTVIDLHSPERVRNDDVESKCGWSPYEGEEFPGRARWVVAGGVVLLDDFEPVR